MIEKADDNELLRCTVEAAREHTREGLGEERAARQFRKHLLAYLKDAGADKELRSRAAHVSRRADVIAVLEEFRGLPSDGA